MRSRKQARPETADHMSTKDVITLAVAAVGAAVALLTFVRALLEYRQQGRQRRTEQFFAFSSRIENQPSFQRIRDLLDAELTPGDAASAELGALQPRTSFDS